MHRLDIDFHRPPAPSALGWALLLAGVAALAALLAVQWQWREEAQELQAALQQAEARLPRNAPRRAGKDDAALAAARQAIAKARLPWDGLFAALESADNEDVAVLAVAPDGPRGLVKVHAESRNLAAMLAFQRRLEQGGGLRQVTLLEHDAAGDKGGAPVRFHISAAWGGNHGHP
ncbi:MAG: hypothetical protein H6R10_3583 [Rhodocyclaceae bacterium]|nr:hypothetical protein [Rhodocyclaceae bacterium]